MNKTVSPLLILLLTVVFASSALAKKDKKRDYYYMITQECEIAVPYDLKINATHLEDRGIYFSTKYKTVLKTLTSFKSILISKRKEDSYSKILKLARSLGLRLDEERTIGFLKYLKFSDDPILKKRVNKYYLFGKTFVFRYANGTDDEMEYIIDHCLETAEKKGD